MSSSIDYLSGLSGVVTVSHEVLTSAGQFTAVTIAPQQYRWLEVVFCGNSSASSVYGVLEVNGTVTGFMQRGGSYSNNHTFGTWGTYPYVGGTCGSSVTPANPAVWRITLALRPSGPHPYVAQSGLSNGVYSSEQTNTSEIGGQNTDTNVLTSVRVMHWASSPGTFSAGSSLTVFGKGVS